MLSADEITKIVEQVMDDHALSFTYTDHRHREVDRCRCGTQHPTHRHGQWPTHRQHVAREAAETMAARLAQTVATV